MCTFKTLKIFWKNEWQPCYNNLIKNVFFLVSLNLTIKQKNKQVKQKL